MSTYEDIFEQMLVENNIRYSKERSFSGLKMPDSKNCMRYDFYLPDYKAVVEIDGEQHYQEMSSKFFDNRTLAENQTRDMIKNYLGMIHGFQVIRIPGNKLDQLDMEGLCRKLSKLKFGTLLDLKDIDFGRVD